MLKTWTKQDTKGLLEMKKIFCLLIAILSLLLCLTSCGLTVPRPKIKSGEFNFSVTYEYKGAIQTVSGVYVCEYDGTEWYLDGGSVREWKGYIKGGTDDDFVYLDVFDDGDEVILVLNLDPEYFMGDYNLEIYDVPAPYIMIKDYTEEGMRFLHEVDEIEEICSAKIVSYEYDAPIENSFGLSK